MAVAEGLFGACSGRLHSAPSRAGTSVEIGCVCPQDDLASRPRSTHIWAAWRTWSRSWALSASWVCQRTRRGQLESSDSWMISIRCLGRVALLGRRDFKGRQEAGVDEGVEDRLG